MKKKIFRSHISAGLVAQSFAQKALSTDSGTEELVLLPVLPASPFKTVPEDYRSDITFIYDADGLIQRYNTGGRKANLSVEHNTLGDTRSRGYAVELTNAAREPDYGMEPGLVYGWFRLSELGSTELKQSLWLYTSAEARGTWLDDSTYQLTRFTGHTLTNTPATEMPANFSAQEEPDAEDVPDAAGYTGEQPDPEAAMLKTILEKLGLAADADEATTLARIEALQAPHEAEQALTTAGFTVSDVSAGLVRTVELTAARAEIQTLTAQVSDLSTQLTAAQTAAQELRAQAAQAAADAAESAAVAAVDAAIVAFKAKPTQRDNLLSWARADLTAFNAWAAEATPIFDNKTPAPQVENTFGLTADEQAQAKRAGTTFESYAAALQLAREQLGL